MLDLLLKPWAYWRTQAHPPIEWEGHPRHTDLWLLKALESHRWHALSAHRMGLLCRSVSIFSDYCHWFPSPPSLPVPIQSHQIHTSSSKGAQHSSFILQDPGSKAHWRLPQIAREDALGYLRAAFGLLWVPVVFVVKGPLYSSDAQHGPMTVLTSLETAGLTWRVSYCSVAKSCSTLRKSVDCSTLGSLVYHCLLELKWWPV